MSTDTLNQIRLGLFFSAILLYGFAGSPTPDHPGTIELLIGIFLILSAGLGGLRRLIFFRKQENLFLISLHFLFLFGLIVPSLVGAIHGHEFSLMVRDWVAFCFLCLPLFMIDVFHQNPRAARLLPWVLVIAGLVFAIRTLLPILNVWTGEELLYLANSPMVLFAAIFLIGLAWQALMAPSVQSIGRATVFLMGVMLCLAAMMLDVQRATVGAIGLSLFILWCLGFWRQPMKVIFPSVLFILIGFLLWPQQQGILDAVFKKTAEVGLNMRVQEMMAVITLITRDPLTVLFGTGWGGVLSSPAVGGLDVNFTHSFLTTMAMKGGLSLFLVALFVCFFAMIQIFKVSLQNPARGLAVLWPFVIPVFLYASHKSLDFGLILLMIGVWSNAAGRLHIFPRSCMEKGETMTTTGTI
jgi:hypothetical protein